MGTSKQGDLEMTNLMNEIISEASKKMNENKVCYGFSHRAVSDGKLSVRVLAVDTNSKHNVTKNWTLNGKKISAANVMKLGA